MAQPWTVRPPCPGPRGVRPRSRRSSYLRRGTRLSDVPPGAEAIAAPQTGPRGRGLLRVTSTHGGSHAATAEVPHKADQIAAAPRTEQGAKDRHRLERTTLGRCSEPQDPCHQRNSLDRLFLRTYRHW